MNTNIKDLTTAELIYLAEYMICVLDCRARNDDEYATPDDLIKDDLTKVPILLDMAGWHEDAKTLRSITLENITENADFLYDLEWKCLGIIDALPPYTIRYDLVNESNTFDFNV